VKLGLDWIGVPCLMGPGFSPKLILDLLDDMSYPMLLSGTLGGLMLWLIGQSCVFS
jgi:hypothetical protein